MIEMGRELKASELESGTVVVLTKEGREGVAVTAWVRDVGETGVVFYAGELRLYVLCYRMGDELHDDNGRLHAWQWLGDQPTSGMGAKQ